MRAFLLCPEEIIIHQFRHYLWGETTRMNFQDSKGNVTETMVLKLPCHITDFIHESQFYYIVTKLSFYFYKPWQVAYYIILNGFLWNNNRINVVRFCMNTVANNVNGILIYVLSSFSSRHIMYALIYGSKVYCGVHIPSSEFSYSINGMIIESCMNKHI